MNEIHAFKIFKIRFSRSHALRGNAVKARCAASHDHDLRIAYTGRSASSTAFPRSAWERGGNVIAEGVETEQQRQLLLNRGCTHYQGYLFSKPVPIEQFEAFLNQGYRI